MIKCNACGKRYNYHEHGCCPHCGAYNRPPRRNWVSADGTIHHLKDGEFLSGSGKGRGGKSGKVCFEREVCFEEQARKVRHNGPEVTSPFDRHEARPAQKKEQSGADRRKKMVRNIVLVVVLLNVLPALLTMCNFQGDVWEDVLEIFDVEAGWDDVVLSPDAVAPADRMIQVGETFSWWDAPACVEEVHMNEWEEATDVELVVWRDTVEATLPSILYMRSDGTTAEAACKSAAYDDAYYTYRYTLSERAVGSACWVLFAGYNGGEYVELSLPLTDDDADAMTAVLYRSVGESFLWWDAEAVVKAVAIAETDSSAEVQVIVVQDEELDEPTLLYWDEDSWESMTFCQDYEDLGDGKYCYTFWVEDRLPGSDCWVVFAGYNGDMPCEVRVLLSADYAVSMAEINGRIGREVAVGEEVICIYDAEVNQLNEEDGAVEVTLWVERTDANSGSAPTLAFCPVGETTEIEVACDYFVAVNGSEVGYRFVVKDMDPEEPCYALFHVDGRVARFQLN